MRLEDHCAKAMSEFGREFREVHEWLDEFAGRPGYGMRHRRVRHHEAGISEAVRLFGKEAGDVARRHVIADLKEEGWKDSDPFPRDEAHYVEIGLF